MHGGIITLIVMGITALGLLGCKLLSDRGLHSKDMRASNKVLAPILEKAVLVDLCLEPTKILYLSSGFVVEVVPAMLDDIKGLIISDGSPEKKLAYIPNNVIAWRWERKIKKLIKQWESQEFETKMEQLRGTMLESLEDTKKRLQRSKGSLSLS